MEKFLDVVLQLAEQQAKYLKDDALLNVIVETENLLYDKLEYQRKEPGFMKAKQELKLLKFNKNIIFTKRDINKLKHLDLKNFFPIQNSDKAQPFAKLESALLDFKTKEYYCLNSFQDCKLFELSSNCKGEFVSVDEFLKIMDFQNEIEIFEGDIWSFMDNLEEQGYYFDRDDFQKQRDIVGIIEPNGNTTRIEYENYGTQIEYRELIK